MARDQGEALLAEAESKKDYHLGLAICGRIAHALEQGGAGKAEAQALEARMEKIAAEHDAAHPHHANHHHHHD